MKHYVKIIRNRHNEPRSYRPHLSIQPGNVFVVVDELESYYGEPGYMLAGISGKPLPWRAKVRVSDCATISPLEMWAIRLRIGK